MKTEIPSDLRSIELLPLNVVEAILNISKSKLYELLKAGTLSAVRQHGAKQYIPRQVLVDYLESLPVNNGERSLAMTGIEAHDAAMRKVPEAPKPVQQRPLTDPTVPPIHLPVRRRKGA